MMKQFYAILTGSLNQYIQNYLILEILIIHFQTEKINFKFINLILSQILVYI